MTTQKLGQAWVSSVTNPDAPEIAVVGGGLNPIPGAAEYRSVLKQLAQSDAAREMVRRKWFQPGNKTNDKVAERGEALFSFLFGRATALPSYAMFRGRRLRAQRGLLEEISTQAWIAHVTQTAEWSDAPAGYATSNISGPFVRHLAGLSVLKDGPKQALHALRSVGICVVVESTLPGMSIDGASFHASHIGRPVLAMTLRHDRLDNFWFTLFHEIGHIALHVNEPSDDIFVDSFEDGAETDEQEAEAEADAFAKDGLIPRDTWLRSEAHRLGSESSIVHLAKQLGIHPAIVAGRIRYERRDFRLFSHLLGQGQVREVIFTD
jgi:HTH-type transcriptional regulator / antitoxin HigA